MEKQFQLRLKQGRDAQVEKMGPLSARRSAVKRRLSHLYGADLLGLCLPSGHLSGFFFYPTSPGTLPWMCLHPSAKNGS